MMTSNEHAYTNALIEETSPYLLQHAHNPVDWHAWNEETLAKAKKENKLLIISIGYSACHWCHVMEHESFEDTLVAEMMNEYFIPVKVDREERPDVDDVYMTACHLVSGSGGWPLNAFALPDGKPIWAGTYYPKDQWLNILEQFKNLQETDYPKLQDQAEKLTAGIQNQDEVQLVQVQEEFSKKEMSTIAELMLRQMDLKEGGKKGAPKFPMPNNFEFLLKYHHASQSPNTFEAVKKTLDKMAFGGIYDQIGGGFARYSVDSLWQVPHFEKMLYDNSQLVSLYAQAYKLTKDELYKQVIEKTLSWVKREMTHSSGGFYSALDADSEGIEGKFYVWTRAEIDSLLYSKEHADIYSRYYNVTNQGNWEHGVNILNRSLTDKEAAKERELSVAELRDIILKGNEALMQHRATRVRPGLDDKVLTSWNALMLKGYVDAYHALGNDAYLNTALANGEFILKNQKQKDHSLLRNFKDDKSSINGFLDDYAITIDAFIALYQATFDEKWLDEATSLMDYVLAHFFKESNSMFNYTSDLDPPLVARKSVIGDNAIPGSNSIMGRNLKTLGELLYNKKYLSLSTQMLSNMHSTLTNIQQPSFYSNWCQLFYDMAYPPYEVAIVGDNAEAVRKEMMKDYSSNVLYLGGKEEGSLRLLEDKHQEGSTLIYVCQNKVCKFPVEDPQEALKLLTY